METAELRLRKVSKELLKLLKVKAEERSLSLRSFLVAELWHLVDGTKSGTDRGTKKGQTRKVWVKQGEPGREEFELRLAKRYREKAYHFDLQRFLAHYDSNGGKVGKNQMQNVEQCMVTFEANWKEQHPAKREYADLHEIVEAGRAAARARGDID